MQETDSFKKFFWFALTRELIKNSQTPQEEIIKRKEKISEQIKERRAIKNIQLPKEKFQEKQIFPKFEKRIFAPEQKPPTFERAMSIGTSQAPRLAIPELRLPPTLQYLKPLPTQKEIDLERLNPLMKDPLVKIIECNGADEPLIVEGNMGRKRTDIVLNKDEIDKIIDKFSKESKIPILPGIYRVVIGRLSLSAVISNVIGSKFVIKKLVYNPDLVKPIQQRNFPQVR